jgi:hypothetical protein
MPYGAPMARNYYSVFWVQFRYSSTFQAGDAFAVGSTLEDLMDNDIPAVKSYWIDLLQPEPVDFEFPNAVINAWHLVDKPNLMAMFRTGTTGDPFLRQVFCPGPPLQLDPQSPLACVTDSSPRKTGWTDVLGEDRGPYPSDLPPKKK